MREWPVELQLPTREIGPRPEPEVYPTRFLLSEGQWTPEEHVAELRKAAQTGNYYAWNREAREEAERQNQEYVRSMSEWKAVVERRGFKDHPAVPQGPPPKRTSSTRALPNVHDALCQNVQRLQRRNLSLQRRPLQQQEEVGQQVSIQEMNFQGLVQHQCSHHHLQSHHL